MTGIPNDAGTRKEAELAVRRKRHFAKMKELIHSVRGRSSPYLIVLGKDFGSEPSISTTQPPLRIILSAAA
jgi:hypothetical protein